MTPARGDADLVYAGFWIRVWAAIIDTVLLLVVLFPLLSLIPGIPSYYSSGRLVNQYGQINYAALGMGLPGPIHILLFWVLPAVVVVLFWIARLATPGKMAIGATIVDARSGAKPNPAQYILRYIGYFVSTLPFCLGLLWVGVDPRKQGWHDKIAATVVVRSRRRVLARAEFEQGGQPEHSPEQSWKT